MGNCSRQTIRAKCSKDERDYVLNWLTLNLGDPFYGQEDYNITYGPGWCMSFYNGIDTYIIELSPKLSDLQITEFKLRFG